MRVAYWGGDSVELNACQWGKEETGEGRKPAAEGHLGLDPSKKPGKTYTTFQICPSQGQGGWGICPPPFIPIWLIVFWALILPDTVDPLHPCTKPAFETRETSRQLIPSAYNRKPTAYLEMSMPKEGSSSQSEVHGPAASASPRELVRNANG